MPKVIIEIGTTMGDLVYIGEAGNKVLPSGQKPRLINCKCNVCGRVKEILFLHFIRGRTLSCGCKVDVEWRKDFGKRIHNIWRSIHCRTKDYNKGSKRKSYFEKGIIVCDEWKSYTIFKIWALSNGFKEDLQLDRIDNSKGYNPNNCRFVTPTVNVNNRDVTIMVEYHGVKVALMEICRELGFDKTKTATIYNRVHRGWDGWRAIDTPIRVGNYSRGKNHYQSKK